LKTVSLVGVNSETLNSTAIEWGNDNSTITAPTMVVPTTGNQSFIDGNNVKSWFSSDVNGDGLTDLACCFKATKYVSDLYFETYTCSLDNSGKPTFSLKSSQIINDFTGLSSGSFFVLPSPVFRTPPISYADLKGDKNKVTVYPKWIGGPTNAFRFKVEGADDRIETSLVGTEMPAFSIADINNDGIDEIITVEKGVSTSGMVTVKICYSKSLTEYSWKTLNLFIGAIPRDILVEDFDGDGLKDIVVVTDNGVNFYKNNGGVLSADNYITVSFSNPSSLSIFNANYSAIKVGDFNGDGLLDFILNEHCNSNWKLALNNGKFGFDVSALTNFTAVEESYTDKNDNKEDCIVTDFNNDGKSDVILIDPVYNTSGAFVQTNVTWYTSTGTGFTVAKTFTTTDENYTFNRFNVLGDFDGDGREELFTYGSDIYNGNSKSDMAYIHSSPNTNFEAGLVKSVTDGFGNKTNINYLPITHSVTSDNKPFYTKGSGSVYPVADLQASVYCVSQLLEPDGLGGLNTTEFAYSEARAQQTGRGFLGFKTRTISNATTNRKIVSTTDMNLTYYLPDKETTTITTTGGAAVSKTENYYTNSKTGSIYLSQPSQTAEMDYLNDLSKTTNYLSFDAYGNATSVRTTQGDLVSTQTSTYVQKGSWCPNKTETVSITRQQGSETYTRSKSYTYDDKGNLNKEITDPGDANQLTVEYKNWNVFGQPTTTETTANGILRTASIGFTPSGRFVQSKTDVLGQTTTYSWDETRGLLNSQTSRIGTTTYTYNGLGQLTNTAYPDGTHKSQTTQWATAGNAYGAKFYVYQEASGAASTYTWFDGLQHEVVRETYGLNGRVSRVFTQYRADGKTYRVSAPTFDSQPTVWDAVYDYYPEGRLNTVVTPQGTTTTTYSGKITTVTSPEGTQTSALNAAGQTATSTANGKTVTYAYYASGKAKTATPDGGTAVAMEYDLQGNRTKLTDPDAGVSTAGYNGYGELKWEKQTNNAAQGEITTAYNYNATTGQIESRVRNGETTSYDYDTYKRLSTVEIAGQHKQTYAYGDYDRVSSLTELIGSRSFNKQMGYDTYGRVSQVTYPSGYYTVNNYDSYGNLSEVTDRSGRSVWKATEANARGQLTRVSKGAKETVYGYDDTKGQLTSMTAAGVVNYGYSYDVKNNLEYRSDNLLGQKEHFSYDTQNRLTNWDIMNGSNVVLKPNSITYDGSTGNITAKSDLNSPATVAFNYEKTTNPRALTTITPQSSIISGDELTVTYTDFRKIKTLTEGNKQYTISYGVDDQRRRSVQTQGGTSLTRYYLGDYEEETDQLGNVKKIHYLSGGSQLITLNGVETLYYGYADNQGSLVALTDVSGNVVEKYAYDPWGARRNPNDWTQNDSRTSWITNRGYTGHEHLDLFNIINMNGRVYDPLTAMFFSPDPFIQSPDNWLNYNRYSYCLNNPTMFIDPTGYQQVKQYEDGNSSPWSVFDQLAQTERRLGISNGSIGGSSFGRGFAGYSYSDAYIEARSEGFAGTYSDFRSIANTQMSRAYFDGTVTVHTWSSYAMNDQFGVVAKQQKTITVNVTSEKRLGGNNLSTLGNWTNGVGVGLGAISTSVGRAIQNEAAYVNTTSFIKPIQTMLKVGPANLLISNTLSKTLTRTGVGLSAVSALITVADGMKNGWENHHTADLIVNGTLTGLSVVCPVAGLVAGGLYFVGDIASQYYYHKSLTEKLFDE